MVSTGETIAETHAFIVFQMYELLVMLLVSVSSFFMLIDIRLYHRLRLFIFIIVQIHVCSQSGYKQYFLRAAHVHFMGSIAEQLSEPFLQYN